MQYKKQILPVIGLVVLLLCFMTLFKRSGRTSGSVEEVAEASQEGAVMEDDIGGSDIKPGCEIKFLLDSELTLSEDNELKKSALKAFEIEEDPTSYEVIYLDTQGRDYLKEGWINRIRLKEGKSKYTLTYKKRYDVENDNIEEALETAAGDGFTLTDNRYSAEIDWGYSKMTLSLSNESEVKMQEDQDISLPEEKEAKSMASEYMPSEEKNWGVKDWGTKLLDNAEIVGPVTFLRYPGELCRQSVRIEIWPIPDENGQDYIVELSKKCDTMEEAVKIREDLMKELDKMGMLIHSDSLKTSLILQ